MRKILYSGFGWASNIGNSFIDYGIIHCLNQSKKEEDILELVSNTTSFHKRKVHKGFPYRYFPKRTSSPPDFRTLVKHDFVVFGGSLLDPYWFAHNQEYLEYLKETKTKIILLGVGGGNLYSESKFRFVESILKNLNIYALVTRDEPTYNKFHKYAKYSYNGIDNALFLNDVYTPTSWYGKNMGVFVFDFHKEPKIEPFTKDLKIFRIHNSLTDMVGYQSFLKNPFKQKRWIQESIVVSDHPYEYLNVFGNSSETYSDRVHACIATLIYGGKAKYFDDSGRANLFERIGIGNIRNNLMTLDMSFIEKEKEKQLAFLNKIFSE